MVKEKETEDWVSDVTSAVFLKDLSHAEWE